MLKSTDGQVTHASTRERTPALSAKAFAHYMTHIHIRIQRLRSHIATHRVDAHLLCKPIQPPIIADATDGGQHALGACLQGHRAAASTHVLHRRHHMQQKVSPQEPCVSPQVPYHAPQCSTCLVQASQGSMQWQQQQQQQQQQQRRRTRTASQLRSLATCRRMCASSGLQMLCGSVPETRGS